MNITKTFANPGTFNAVNAAQSYLHDRGFSLGTMERGSPRGILFGDYPIGKLRNLSDDQLAAMHGIMTGDMRNGPVTVTLFDSAPDEAKRAFDGEAP